MQALIVDDDIATVDVVENSIDWKLSLIHI